MCGIYGYFDQNDIALSSEVLVEMAQVIAHRGPDGHGIYHENERAVALGNQRLAILDVEHGQQPFFSADQQIVVVQNGEIFNHVELAEELAADGFVCNTHCDTEVILRLYERSGIDGLKKLNGMFAIAIYDRVLDQLFLFRDRAGEKPLYYHYDNGRLLFGSEIKVILQAVAKAEPCYQAINQYLAFNFVPPPLTMFNHVFHVMPGHWIRFSRDEIEQVCWWDITEQRNIDQTEAEWIEEFNTVLDDAVKIRLRSDVPFGAFLSGGVDSSSVVGYMSKHMQQPVKTYCIGFDDPKYDESPFAQEAAKRFSTDHTLEKVDPNMIDLWPLATYHCDQPHGDVSFLPTYKVAELASRDVKMVLTGDGADELFAGYDKYKNFFSDSIDMHSDSEFLKKYLDNISLFDKETRGKLYGREFEQQMGELDVTGVLRPIIERSAHMDRINQALMIDFILLLPGNNLVKPDRMGMAVSIENRAPFLDFRMMELAFSMPGNLKLKKGETKYLYKKAVSSLIGKDLAYRKKQMFTVPVGEWFKTELLDMCKDLLLSERTRSRCLFDYEFVSQILMSHVDGLSNNTREIRALMALELWFREFIDEC